ncbi:QRFP-like peptide receptor [Argopecten irradians]|uniref:QRFP-like peptide receptor n=1 Tax=Argopecten irradians TaxID=31199 RepID=UPI00371BC8DB
MHEPYSVTFLVIDVTLMILVIIFNLIVIIILFTKANVRKSKNILLLSLAFADMFIGIFVIPNAISIMFLHVRWVDAVCKLCYYGEYAVSAASALSISVMAVDRMRAILFPFKFKGVHHYFSYLTLGFVWMIALLYALRTPFIFGAVTKISGNVSHTECTIIAGRADLHKRLVYMDFIVLFLLPSAVLVTCNVAVSVRIASQPKIRISGGMQLLIKRRRSIRLLLAMIFLFIGCHLPLYSFRIHLLIVDSDVPMEKVITQCLLILSWLNSLLNVLFYGSLNKDVKSTLAVMGKCQCFKQPNRVGVLTSGTVTSKDDQRSNDLQQLSSTQTASTAI